MSGRIGFTDVIKVKESAMAGQFRRFLYHYSHLTIHKMVQKRNVATDRQVERAPLLRGNITRMDGGDDVVEFLVFLILGSLLLYGFGVHSRSQYSLHEIHEIFKISYELAVTAEKI